MQEQRRVRFSTIDGLAREDLPLAYEIWLQDILNSSWASREAMKLSAHLVRYMMKPNPEIVLMREIERECHLARDDVQRALMLMKTFLVVEGYYIEKDDVKIALNLSQLQRLQTLESRQRFAELTEMATGVRQPAPPAAKEARWLPPEWAEKAAAEDDEAVAPLVALISEHIRSAAGQRRDAADAA